MNGENMEYAVNPAEEELKIARDNATTLLPLMEDETVRVHHQSRHLVMS